MTRFENLKELLEKRNELDWDSWIYCNVEQWNKTPNNTVFYHVSENEALEYDEDSETRNPMFCVEMNIQPFLEFETFNDIIEVSRSKDVQIVIKAINYYREYDTFLE